MTLSARGRAVVILIATIVGVAITANLGAWQLRRAVQKIALQDALESRARLSVLFAPDLAHDEAQAQAQHYRPVHLRGHWVAAHSVFLDNRQMAGRAGFYLVTPLQLEGRREAVLVQRGWVPRDQRDRTLLPTVPTPGGVVEVDGRIAPPPARLYEFAPSASGAIRQNLDLDEFRRETGLALAPLSVLESSETADFPVAAGAGLLRQWPRPAVDVQKHYGYAFQWFALCALMAGLYVWFQLVRPRRKRHARA
ncbi:MAG: SURF1 family protein [Burkholderiaceae bacterium]